MKTKKTLITISILIFGFKFQMLAQEINQCGQQQVMDNWFKSHPDDKLKFEANQKAIALNQNKTQSTSSTPNYTIPVVFHILHTGGAENISDAQVLDQINILNRDYQKQNADTINVVSSFTNNIAKVNFAFKLATIDPNGNCTNGIIRHYDSNSYNWPLSVGNFSQYAYTWPTNQYLNIYVVGNIVGLDGAYTILPGTPIPFSADVIVTEHYVTGSIGTANVANSRVLTHEVGHWFNLLHIWGSSNQPGVACGDDNVGDTPITKGFTVCNTANTDICTPGIFENIQNYMDYAPCKIMFTNGQAARMLATINGTVNGRNNLSSPSNLIATGVTSSATNCIPFVEVSAATKSICVGSSLTVFSYTSNANSTSYSWTANNGAIVTNSNSANATVQLNNIGNSTVICTAINANGNNTASIVLTAINSSVQISNNYFESFETTGVIPPNWVVTNQGSGATWAQTSIAGIHGTSSILFDGPTSSAGDVAILQMPMMDVVNNPSSVLSFKYAYARQTTTQADVFKVQASKDCGGTWSDVYSPSPATMANGSGGVTNIPWAPSASQWKTYNITYDSPFWFNFQNSSNVLVRFYFKEDPASGNGNRLFLDAINIVDTAAVGINELTKNIQFNLSPNPTTGEAKIKFNLNDPAHITVSVVDMLGREVLPVTNTYYGSGEQTLIVNKNSLLPRGIYFVNVNLNGTVMSRKLIVQN